MQRLKELLEDFYRISGKGIAIVDKNFCTVLTRSSHDAEKFCTYIHQSQKCLEMCLKSDKTAFKTVENSKSTYIYTCPFGIKEALVPILDANTVIGYFFVVLGIENNADRGACINSALEEDSRFEYFVLKQAAELLNCDTRETEQSFLNILNVMGEHIAAKGLLKVRQLNVGMRIKEYIDENIDRKITLMSLSKLFHCSKVTLTQSFKHEFGISIMNYVNLKRMEKAVEMLRLRGLSISEIATSCGFCDAEYFSRCFKKQYGVSPMEWKKQNGCRIMGK